MSTAAHSPTDSQADEGSQQRLQRRATIGDPVYDNHAISRQRQRTPVVACERCRRRKIRCDGLQPCATCARFGVRCTKPEERRQRSSSNAEHAALADRVRMLEARLAAVSTDELAESYSNPRPGPPALHLDTTFDAAIPQVISMASGMDDMSMSDGFLSPNVPTIQITGPHGSNPSSPLALSPSPSLFSGTSRASSPDPFAPLSAFDYGLGAGSTSLTIGSQSYQRTPPMNQWAEVYNQNLQTPVLPGSHHISRRSSVSSFGGLGEALCNPAEQHDDWSMNDPYLDSDLNGAIDNVGQSMPESMPSKAQAEVVAEQVFSTRFIPIERSAFRVCLEAIYMLPSHTADAPPQVHAQLSSYTTYSLRMARCLVFLVLTIGLRSSGMDDSSFSGCYRLAMHQMRTPDFWSENGSQEIAALFMELSKM